MRVSYTFVLLAVFFVAQTQCASIMPLKVLNLDTNSVTSDLPLALDSVSNVADNLPALNLKRSLSDASSGLMGDGGLLGSSGLPLVNSLPGLSSLGGMKSVPVLGNALSGLNVKRSLGLSDPLHQILPGGEPSGSSGLPLVNSLPGLSTLSGMKSVPVVGNALPGLNFKRSLGLSDPLNQVLPGGALPGSSGLPLVNSLPGLGGLGGMTSLPVLGDALPGFNAKRSLGLSDPLNEIVPSGALPGSNGLPLVNSLPSLSSLGGMTSLPVLGDTLSGLNAKRSLGLSDPINEILPGGLMGEGLPSTGDILPSLLSSPSVSSYSNSLPVVGNVLHGRKARRNVDHIPVALLDDVKPWAA